MPAELTFDQKVELFRKTAEDKTAREKYAASRATMILPLLDTQSTIRAIFNPERLPAGATPTWDIPFEDIECTWMMPNIGGIPTVQVEGAEIHVDTFGVDGGVEYQRDVARDGRFPVGALATQLLKNKFIGLEEISGWSLIKTHAATLTSAQIVKAFNSEGKNGDDVSTGRELNIHTINEVITTADELGIGGRRVTDIYCSPRRFGDFRKAISVYGLPEAMRQQLWGGGQGTDSVADIRLHRVYNRNLVDNDTAYAFTQKDGYFYGVMPIREELNTMDNALSAMEWKIGIVGRERIGFGVIDDKGLIKISFV